MIAAATKEDLDFCFDARSVKNTGISRNDAKEEDFIVCRQDGHAMLAYVIPLGNAAEVHVVCPQKSAIRSRSLASEIMNYLKFIGFVAVFTRVSKNFKKAHNMLIKLGFVEVFSGETERFYWRYLLCQ